MEQDLQFIQNQLWFLIALLGLIAATNILCYFSNKSEKEDKPQFGEMWDKDELDKLIKEARKHLIEYPNHQSALYFCAKALITKRENLDEAKKYLEKFMEIEPAMKDDMRELIDEINKIQGS